MGSEYRPPKRSRKVQAALVLASSLVIIVGAFLVVRATSLWYWTPITERSILKLYALATDPVNYDALIIGASVADFGYYPEVMEDELQLVEPRPQGWKVFNVSIQAAFLPTYLEIMRNIVGHGQRPRAAVLAVTLRDFNGNSKRVRRQVRFFARSPSDFLLVLREGTGEQRWSAAHALTHGLEALIQYPLKPFYADDIEYFRRGQGKVMLAHYPVLHSLMAKDEAGEVTPEALDRLRTNGVAEFRTELMNDFAINGLIDAWFRAILAEARAKGVRLAVVLAPETHWFAENAYRGEKELVVAYLTRVCAEEGAPFYDLRDPRFRPADTDFFDRCDHLAAPGAERFSRAVAHYVLAPLLAPEATAPGAATPEPVPPTPDAPPPPPDKPADPDPNRPPLPDGKPVPDRTGIAPPPAAAE